MKQKYQKLRKKCLVTYDYKKFTNDILNAKIKENELVNKSAISRFIDNSNLNNKIAPSATKAELKTKKDKIKQYKHFIV